MGEPYDPDFNEEVPGVNQPWDANTPPPPPANPVRAARSPEDVRMWTLIAHASAIPSAFFALAFVGPLIVWLIRKDIDPISGAHAKEALHFNISVMIYAAISFVLAFVLIGIPMLIALGIFWLVNVIRASVAVSDGRTFRYPLTMRMF